MADTALTRSEHFEILDFLGSGSYGSVYAAKAKGSDALVAIKGCKDILSSRTLAKRTLREIRILRFCHHPNIVKLLKVLVPDDTNKLSEFDFMFELLDTDLSQIIRSPQVLMIDHVQYFTAQLISALEYLHRSHVIHRDVKPRNILINADCTLKLADFGLAKVFEEGIDATSTVITDYVTTRWYRAPEVLAGCTKYGAAVDMWAVGCIIAELFLRVPMFPGSDTNRQLELIINTLGLPDRNFMAGSKRSIRKFILRIAEAAPLRSNLRMKFGRIPYDALDMITKLLVLDPSTRLSASQCMVHRFVTDVCYPQNAETLTIDPSAFDHEKNEITIDILRQEILKEVQVHNSLWNLDVNDEGVATATEMNISSASEDFDDGAVLAMPSVEIPRELQLVEVSLSESKALCSSPMVMVEAAQLSSNASVSSMSTEIKSWIEDGKSSLETRPDRVMSQDTVLASFSSPPQVVTMGCEGTIAPVTASTLSVVNDANMNREASQSDDLIMPFPKSGVDYELRTLRSNAARDDLVMITSNLIPSTTEKSADCKSLLSLGLCSSGSGSDSLDKMELSVSNDRDRQKAGFIVDDTQCYELPAKCSRSSSCTIC